MTATVESDDEIKLLLQSIFERYSYDFRRYSLPSVRRRVRSALGHFGLARVADLRERVLEEPSFFLSLVQFLTISTSEMFRDPAYFLGVRRLVVPILRTYPSLKIWIAGCSTGEEVYSMAILLREENLLERATIYATDINPVSLSKAESGIFPAERIAAYGTQYLAAGGRASFADYYTANYDSVLFDKSLRKNVVFADHSLATDTVFSEVQFVSCRNVLIYFDRDLQNRALGLFDEALSHRGFLGLGAKETLRFSNFDRSFEPVGAREKLYRRI